MLLRLRRPMLAGLICRLIVVVMPVGRLRSRSGHRSGESRRWLLVCGAVLRVRMHGYVSLAFVYAVFLSSVDMSAFGFGRVTGCSSLGLFLLLGSFSMSLHIAHYQIQ